MTWLTDILGRARGLLGFARLTVEDQARLIRDFFNYGSTSFMCHGCQDEVGLGHVCAERFARVTANEDDLDRLRGDAFSTTTANACPAAHYGGDTCHLMVGHADRGHPLHFNPRIGTWSDRWNRKPA